MKNLSRKEVFNLIVESLNEADQKDGKTYQWGADEIPKDLAVKIIGGMFSFNSELRDHYIDVVKGGKLEKKPVLLQTLNYLFDQLPKIQLESKRKETVDEIIFIINEIRKDQAFFNTVKKDILDKYKIYYGQHERKSRSELEDLPESDKRLIDSYNHLKKLFPSK